MMSKDVSNVFEICFALEMVFLAKETLDRNYEHDRRWRLQQQLTHTEGQHRAVRCDLDTRSDLTEDERKTMEKKEGVLQKTLAALRTRLEEQEEADQEKEHLKRTPGPLFLCDGCGCELTPACAFDSLGNYRHHCTVCPSYDLCHACFLAGYTQQRDLTSPSPTEILRKCVGRTPTEEEARSLFTHSHTHAMYSASYDQRSVQAEVNRVGRSFSVLMQVIFRLYWPRPAFGWRGRWGGEREGEDGMRSSGSGASLRRSFGGISGGEGERRAAGRLCDEYTWITYGEMWERVRRASHSMAAYLGVAKGTFVGICGRNRVDWFVCDIASALLGCTVVPLHASADIDVVSSIVQNAKLRVIVTDLDHQRMFESLYQSQKTSIEHIIVLPPEDIDPRPFARYSANDRDAEWFSIDDTLREVVVPLTALEMRSFNRDSVTPKGDLLTPVQQAGLEQDRVLLPSQLDIFKIFSNAAEVNTFEGERLLSPIPPPPDPSDLSMIIYTSGSTGVPKGAMFTQRAVIRNILDYLVPQYDPYVTISKDSLAHISDREDVYVTLGNGGRVGFASRGICNVYDDIRVLEPSRVSSTPRFWNVLYNEYKKCLSLPITIPPSTSFYGSPSSPPPPNQKERKKEREILRRMRSILGRRIGDVSCGGALLSPDVKHFLVRVFGKKIVGEGYACTEAGQLAGDDGVLHPNVMYRLLDVVEMGYTSADLPCPRGELCVRTPLTISGYYANEEATSAALGGGGEEGDP